MDAVARILPLRMRRRLAVWYGRYRRTFWILHSIWALATGVLVLVLAHERWELAQWVVVFLGVTWASTLFFTRLASRLPDSPGAQVGQEFVSYLTRVMYQETLFFLLPFYWASATPGSWNLLFIAVLALLAILACLDLVFDDLLRRHSWFGLLFFAVVAFASLNFLLPLLLRMRIQLATPLAAAGGLLAALPLVWDRRSWKRPAALAQLAAGLVVAALVAGPARGILPPVPLRLESIHWTSAVREDPVRPIGALGPRAGRDELAGGRLLVVAEVFAPKRLEAGVVIRWFHEGNEIRRSRELEITPHRHGFGVWHAHAPPRMPFPLGRYRVEVITVDGRLLGRTELEIVS